MSAQIVSSVDAHGLKSLLQKASKQFGNPRPVLEVIGQTVLDDAVMQAFRDLESPNGVPWPALKPETLRNREGEGDRPLQRTGVLKRSFNWQILQFGEAVSIGTPHGFYKYHQHLPENEHLNKGIMPERAAIPKLSASGTLPQPIRNTVIDTIQEWMADALGANA